MRLHLVELLLLSILSTAPLAPPANGAMPGSSRDDVARLVVVQKGSWAGEVLYTRLEPVVIPSGRTAPVRLEVKVEGPLSRAVLVPELGSPVPSVELTDDGDGGDLVAGDSVFTALIDPRPVVEALRPDDVLRVFAGFLDLFVEGERVFRASLFLPVRTPEIGTFPVTPLAADAQATTRVVNILDPAAEEGLDPARVVRRFYELFPDELDFIHVVSMLGRFQNRHHITVRNDTLGLGLELFDHSQVWGGPDRLLGVDVFPVPTFFDGADSGYQHELGHQWVAFLGFEPFEQARPHWPLSSLAGGIMGWSLPGGQGGELPCRVEEDQGAVRLVPRLEAPVFTDLDLYLMGLLSEGQVGPARVFPQQGLAASEEILAACDGGIWPDPLIEVTIDEIVAQAGARVPGVATSQKDFRVATILVTHDELLDEDAMSFYSHFARRAEGTEVVPTRTGFAKRQSRPFALATRGLGALDTRILPGEEPAPPPPPPPAGPWLASPDFAGFEAKVEIHAPGGSVLDGRAETRCIDESLCVSGALAGRPEAFLKVIGPRPNGFLWVQVSRFTPSRLRIWIRQVSSGDIRFYELDAVGPTEDDVSGLQDRTAFSP